MKLPFIFSRKPFGLDSGVECPSFFEAQAADNRDEETEAEIDANESDCSRPASTACTDLNDESDNARDDASQSDSCRFGKSSKKQRTAFTPDQIHELERRFTQQKYLSASERADFAAKLKLSDTQVNNASIKIN